MPAVEIEDRMLPYTSRSCTFTPGVRALSAVIAASLLLDLPLRVFHLLALPGHVSRARGGELSELFFVTAAVVLPVFSLATAVAALFIAFHANRARRVVAWIAPMLAALLLLSIAATDWQSWDLIARVGTLHYVAPQLRSIVASTIPLLILAAVIHHDLGYRLALAPRALWRIASTGCLAFVVVVVLNALQFVVLQFNGDRPDQHRTYYVFQSMLGLLIAFFCTLLLSATVFLLLRRRGIVAMRFLLLLLMPLFVVEALFTYYYSWHFMMDVTQSPRGWVPHLSFIAYALSAISCYLGFLLTQYLALGLSAIRRAATTRPQNHIPPQSFPGRGSGQSE